MDWNLWASCHQAVFPGHTSCRCVDWNLHLLERVTFLLVTPHVGVWIETIQEWLSFLRQSVTPHVGVWIETLCSLVRQFACCHTSCRCVDWNIVLVLTSHRKTCHTSCRCVDWNMSITLLPPSTQVTPHVGVWIETVDYSGIAQGLGHTSCRCVDWNLTVNVRRYTRLVTPHVGVWIETSVASNKGQANAGHTSCRCVDWN